MLTLNLKKKFFVEIATLKLLKIDITRLILKSKTCQLNCFL